MKGKYLVLGIALVLAVGLTSCKGSTGGGTAWPFPGIPIATAATWPSSTPSGVMTWASFWEGTSASMTGATPNAASTAWTSWRWTWYWIYGNGVVDDYSLSASTTGGSSDEADDAVDSWGFLQVLAGAPGSKFGQPYNWTSSAIIEDSGFELVFPAQNLMDVDVSRKFLPNWNATVPNRDVWARWLEILTNNSPTTKTVDVVIGGNLGSDDTTQLLATADGDLVLEPGIDNWFVTGDNTVAATSFNDPLLVHLLDGSIAYDKNDWILTNAAGSTGVTMLYYWTTGWSTTPYATSTMTTSASTDSITWRWNNITLLPGETKILMHVELMGLDDMPNILGGPAGAVAQGNLYESAPTDLIGGMDADEINKVINFPAARNNCNVRGGPNSISPNALITVSNATQATVAQSYALPDGSFGVCIDAASGDQIWIGDGANVIMLVVP